MIRIYVASLRDYNNGELFGRWIDATLGADHITEQVQEMLCNSPSNVDGEWPAEEWAIHDYEGFEGWRIQEWEQFDTVATVAEGIEEHGPAFAAFAYLKDGDLSGANWDDFIDHYAGDTESVLDGWRDMIESEYLTSVPDVAQGYVDIDRWAKDWADDDGTVEHNGHVFRCDV